MHQVVVWDNNGEKSTTELNSEIDAIKEAKLHRTINNRTVKIGCGGQSIHHWSRSQNIAKNHWCVRAVFDEFLI